jgi:hypothetical protein
VQRPWERWISPKSTIAEAMLSQPITALHDSDAAFLRLVRCVLFSVNLRVVGEDGFPTNSINAGTGSCRRWIDI